MASTAKRTERPAPKLREGVGLWSWWLSVRWDGTDSGMRAEVGPGNEVRDVGSGDSQKMSSALWWRLWSFAKGRSMWKPLLRVDSEVTFPGLWK